MNYIYKDGIFTETEQGNEYIQGYEIGNDIVKYPNSPDFIHKFVWEVVICGLSNEEVCNSLLKRYPQRSPFRLSTLKKIALYGILQLPKIENDCVFCEKYDTHCSICPLGAALGICSDECSTYNVALDNWDIGAAKRIQELDV